jgi:hypothetical protein
MKMNWLEWQWFWLFPACLPRYGRASLAAILTPPSVYVGLPNLFCGPALALNGGHLPPNLLHSLPLLA